MSHDEIRKYIAIVIALGMLITGVILLTTNIPSEGSIDITTPLLSGKVTSGNIGILLIFFAMILFAVVLGKSAKNNSTVEAISKESKFLRKLIVLIFGWALEVGCVYLAIYFNDLGKSYSTVFVLLSMGGGFAIIVATITFISKTLYSD